LEVHPRAVRTRRTILEKEEFPIGEIPIRYLESSYGKRIVEFEGTVGVVLLVGGVGVVPLI
jgi:hypothetical protein